MHAYLFWALSFFSLIQLLHKSRFTEKMMSFLPLHVLFCGCNIKYRFVLWFYNTYKSFTGHEYFTVSFRIQSCYNCVFENIGVIFCQNIIVFES